MKVVMVHPAVMVRTVRLPRCNKVRAEKEFQKRKRGKAISLATVSLMEAKSDAELGRYCSRWRATLQF